MNYKKEISRLAPALNRGFFIALEGIDGAGKSTQAAALVRRLAAMGLNPAAAHEPTGGEFGARLRGLSPAGREKLQPQEEARLFAQDRAEDVAENIAPALMAVRPVVADRYIASNLAYQGARGLSQERILGLNRDFPWPDLIVMLDVPLNLGLARLRERAGRPDPAFEGADYLAQVHRIFAEMDVPNLVRLDGCAAPDVITEQIIAELKQRALLRSGLPRIVDSHCHLSLKEAWFDLGEAMARARQVGVEAIMDVALNAAHARQVMARAADWPQIHPVVGWHPHEVKDMDEAAFRELMDLAARPEALGFGEIGLDFALMRSPRDCQIAALEKLLDAATGLDKPVVIHSRDAFEETYKLLRKYAPRLKQPGIIHCFTRDWEEAQAYLDINFYLSLPGVVTFPKSDELREVAAKIPAEKLLVETDAPFMAPVPFRGQRNEPSLLIYHLQTIAAARGMTLDEAALLTAQNAHRVYNF